MSHTLEQDLTRGSVFRQLLRFAWPLFLASVLQNVYQLADTFVVGQYLGTAGISGVTVGGNFIQIFTNVIMGLASGGQILVAQLKGAGDQANLKKTIGTFFTLSAVLGVAVAVVSALCCPLGIALLNTPEEAVSHAGDYMLWCALGMPFVFLYNAVSAVMRGLGDSRRPLIFVAVATVLNVGLDFLLVGALDWGAAGAAAATVFAQGCSAAFGFICLFRRRHTFVFDFRPRSFLPSARWLKETLRMGLPIALQMSLINLSLIVILAFTNGYGVAASSALGVGSRILAIFILPMISINTAGSAMAGQNVGAEKYHRVDEVVRISLRINAVLFVFFTAVIFLFGRPLIALFDPSPEVIALGYQFERLQCFNLLGHMVFCSTNCVTLGVGNALYSTLSFLTDAIFVRIPLCLLLVLGFHLGLDGIFWASAVSPLAPAVMLGGYYLSGRWRTYRVRALTGADS